MACYYILFAFLLILSIFPFNSTLKAEKIVGGNEAFEADYRYQVAVMGRHNNSHARLLICNGGIISNFFILSYTECVLTGKYELKRLRFFVIVGLMVLIYHPNNTKEVERIYTFTKNCIQSKSEIAVLELNESLNLGHTKLNLRSLKLPDRGFLFGGREALVAGYGSTEASTGQNERKMKNTITQASNHTLMYAFVQIAKTEDCRSSSSFVRAYKELCGRMKTNMKYQTRGLCTYDEGAPLTIDDIVVGIAGRNSKDCNDTIIPLIYSNVTFYLDFINGILKRNPIKDTVIHYNRPHIIHEPRRIDHNQV